MVAQVLDKILDACCAGGSPLANKMTQQDNDVAVKPAKQNVKPAPMKQAKKNGQFTNKDMKYELTVWKSLPLTARKAAKELGYDETKWDNSEHVHVEHKHWRDLSEDERQAVETLGWVEEAWEHQYQHVKWSELPELQKKAAESAGLTEDNYSHHWPDNLEHKKRDELAEDDKKAMAVLGWCKSAWD